MAQSLVGELRGKKKKKQLYSRNKFGMLEKLVLLGLEGSYRKASEFSIYICFFRIRTLKATSNLWVFKW